MSIEEQLNKDIEKHKNSEVSLSSIFEKRKEELFRTSIYWLILIIISVIVSVWLSYQTITEFNITVKDIAQTNRTGFSLDPTTNMQTKPAEKSNITWMWIILKMLLFFPLIYLITFATNRYLKERRLTEEYAFKSSLSSALVPSIEFIKKLEIENIDNKNRDFLISSIENILSIPSDFGTNKVTNLINKKKNE